MNVVRVCGDCAAVLLERGARRSESIREIDLGHLCDVHPNVHAPQATNVIEHEDPFDPIPSTMPPAEPFERAPTVIEVTRGTVTEIAARLLVAWSTESKGAAADELMIAHAAEVARKLLIATEGA